MRFPNKWGEYFAERFCQMLRRAKHFSQGCESDYCNVQVSFELHTNKEPIAWPKYKLGADSRKLRGFRKPPALGL